MILYFLRYWANLVFITFSVILAKLEITDMGL